MTQVKDKSRKLLMHIKEYKERKELVTFTVISYFCKRPTLPKLENKK